ncbi:MAG: hypothetical protein COS82_07795 [Zetaproteobacteria bacterium CG06_land_8_20_14_3_00_59_53]|nr:MAG: hypothetical protein AUK36_10485 [Zetaproteobacteria bacterium CG2_30_59_37]PIO90343.1 MAG: hypothetical protein COX56_02970 [Zetaproteobacteria bacterium CG23_combo_of_CG06-09_8_20_14_all_59_86]PIQ65091.1 MAG: hypothetical protein COV97_05825 [Zetaproteobacteria bacterium CG11_big_fil_rev_8_21_14_0_20_59_439]PIU70156.1 MAG: hypothetical protein COS82_07795 [Zetaproteobacteria bacterium CG06_land_8_20_14_3_00_59_53]PIU96128.1 MAG: hypothetical protein COS62_10420 [Zetaproteobacteria bac
MVQKIELWLINLRMREGIGAYLLFVLTIALLTTNPLVAAFDMLLTGHIEPTVLYIVAITAPLVAGITVLIINPYVKHILRMKKRIETSQRITGIGSWEWMLDDGEVDYSAESRRIFALDHDCACFECMLEHVATADRERVSAWVQAVCAGEAPLGSSSQPSSNRRMR